MVKENLFYQLNIKPRTEPYIELFQCSNEFWFSSVAYLSPLKTPTVIFRQVGYICTGCRSSIHSEMCNIFLFSKNFFYNYRKSSWTTGQYSQKNIHESFRTCGADYTGSLYYKNGARKNAKSIKYYMMIFVCFATKTVHIGNKSVIWNISKRFIFRRDCPSVVTYSDNGLNFMGVECELDKLTALFNKTRKTQQSIIEHVR